MNDINLNSSKLNNSLVFYRSLFDRMPDEMGINRISFTTDQFRLTVIESVDEMKGGKFYFMVDEQSKLQEIYQRMSRFKMAERIKEDCENIEKAIGLIDPDGNKWVIGNPEVEVNFEKCYVNAKF